MTRSYQDTGALSLRPDLVAAQQVAWGALGEPGTWWTGAERVALAAETRRAEVCQLCAERKQALSPKAVAGSHAATDLLPAAAVEAVHRIRTDPARLSAGWVEELLATGQSAEPLSDGAYVELVSVVATVVLVDTFAQGLGQARRPLPLPQPGEPSRHRPAAARPDGAYVPMIPRGENSGPEADLYPQGFVPNVMRAMSLVPDAVRGFFALHGAHYVDVAGVADPSISGRAISRPQIELIAARVSALNECFY